MYDAEYLIDNIKKSLILACMAVKSTSLRDWKFSNMTFQ